MELRFTLNGLLSYKFTFNGQEVKTSCKVHCLVQENTHHIDKQKDETTCGDNLLFYLPSTLTINLLVHVSGLLDEEAVLETALLITIKAGCLGIGRVAVSLPSKKHHMFHAVTDPSSPMPCFSCHNLHA